MIVIDKQDALYKYLSALQVDNIDEEYLELAKNGRFKLDDIRQYFRATFAPSTVKELEESDLEKVLDYYCDIKSLKHINSKELKEKLKEYKATQNENIKTEIINSLLKDTLYLCLNYSTLHKDVDIQDLIQVANIGLIEAIKKYKPESRVDFKDYMVYYIRKNITNIDKEKTNG